MSICQEDHDQILADPNATTDELRSIIAELQGEAAALVRAVDTDYEQLYREANDQLAALVRSNALGNRPPREAVEKT